MASRSLLPLFGDPQGAAWPGQVVAEHNGHGDAILQRIVIADRYRYVAALFDKDELYDLGQDPYEVRNLIDSSDHAEIADDMRRRMIEHIESTNDRLAAGRLLYALGMGL